MYRPQFVYPVAAAPCIDMRVQYSFDVTNVTAFAAGAILPTWSMSQRIPLQLDQDADFLLRAISISPTNLKIGLEDPNSNPLADPGQGPGFDLYGLPPTVFSYIWGQTMGAGIVALDSDDWGALL